MTIFTINSIVNEAIQQFKTVVSEAKEICSSKELLLYLQNFQLELLDEILISKEFNSLSGDDKRICCEKFYFNSNSIINSHIKPDLHIPQIKTLRRDNVPLVRPTLTRQDAHDNYAATLPLNKYVNTLLDQPSIGFSN